MNKEHNRFHQRKDKCIGKDSDDCFDEWLLTSLPVLIQPLISQMTPRLNILKRIIRVRGSKTCRRRTIFGWFQQQMFLIGWLLTSQSAAQKIKNCRCNIGSSCWLGPGPQWLFIHQLVLSLCALMSICLLLNVLNDHQVINIIIFITAHNLLLTSCQAFPK